MTPLRHPYEETHDYPGLCVHDGRVTGSITAGCTRLPLWAFMDVAIISGWDQAEADWSPSEYGWTAEKAGVFIYYLLEARGDFGRLLLTIANAERTEHRRDREAWNQHYTEVHADDEPESGCQCGFNDGPAWYDDDELKAPVVDALRRCLNILDGDT